jgi:hypothetical protein
VLPRGLSAADAFSLFVRDIGRVLGRNDFNRIETAVSKAKVEQTTAKSIQAFSGAVLARPKPNTDTDSDFIVESVNLRSNVIAGFSGLKTTQCAIRPEARIGMIAQVTRRDAMGQRVCITALHRCPSLRVRRPVWRDPVGFAFSIVECGCHSRCTAQSIEAVTQTNTDPDNDSAANNRIATIRVDFGERVVVNEPVKIPIARPDSTASLCQQSSMAQFIDWVSVWPLCDEPAGGPPA